MADQRYYSSVSPKGQITLPSELRKTLGIKPKDQVVIELVDGTVRVSVARSRLLDHFQMAPALARPLTWREVTEAAAEEHAEAVAREGLE